jgi:hypothetical protein
VTACTKCGFDPDARIAASWSFVLEHAVLSLNARVANVGSARWRYASERDAWRWLVRAAKAKHRIAPAVGRRRLTLTRIYARGQRALDHDNLVGGMKPVVDAIVHEELLVDDKPAWLELHHDQVPGTERAVRVLLEDLADAAPTTPPRGGRR